MSQHRKHRGYATQRLVADYLTEWWPYAESTGAGRSGTDITGTPGVDWEVKARRELRLTETMRQLAERAKDGTVPVAVIRPDGWGPARLPDWPAVLPLSALVQLLLDAGYGPDVIAPVLVTSSEIHHTTENPRVTKREV
jgi:hypothetical protein